MDSKTPAAQPVNLPSQPSSTPSKPITNQKYQTPQSQADRPWINDHVPAKAVIDCPPRNTFARYKYHRLPEDYIRLFMLFPGERDAPLKGAIYSLPLEDAGTYRTLSYVWGDQQQPKFTLATPEGSVEITEGLKTALQKLRTLKTSITLWVDAPCINQGDPVEKAQQIYLLPEIFQGSACTLAFLGADGDSDAAIRTLMQVRAKDVVMGNEDQQWPEDLPVAYPSWDGHRAPSLDAPIWDDVRALFGRTWFRRVWIVQEVVIAPTLKISCGDWMIEWHDLFAAMEVVDQAHEVLSQDLRPWLPFLTFAKHREWEARLKRWPLYLLLENYRHVDSTLKRDRFFALIGLAHDGGLEDFAPDYKVPFHKVALKVGEGMLKQDQGMKLLYRAGLNAGSNLFPSWLPDWTIPMRNSLANSSDAGIEFNACADLESAIDHQKGSDEISVRGWVVDSIAKISTSSNAPKERKAYFNEIDAMLDTLKKNDSTDDIEEWKWKTPIAGAEFPLRVGNLTEDTGLYESYKAFRRLLQKARPGLAEKSMAYVSLLDDKVLGWRFAVTKKGRCALVPPDAQAPDKTLRQAGDKICILRNGVVPFVIRDSSRKGVHRLVGELRESLVGRGEPIRIH